MRTKSQARSVSKWQLYYTLSIGNILKKAAILDLTDLKQKKNAITLWVGNILKKKAQFCTEFTVSRGEKRLLIHYIQRENKFNSTKPLTPSMKSWRN